MVKETVRTHGLKRRLTRALIDQDVQEVKEALEGGAHAEGLLRASLISDPQKSLPILDMLFVAGAKLSPEEIKKFSAMLPQQSEEAFNALTREAYTRAPGAQRLLHLISQAIVPTEHSIARDYGIAFDAEAHGLMKEINPANEPVAGKISKRILTHAEKLETKRLAEKPIRQEHKTDTPSFADFEQQELLAKYKVGSQPGRSPD